MNKVDKASLAIDTGEGNPPHVATARRYTTFTDCLTNCNNDSVTLQPTEG